MMMPEAKVTVAAMPKPTPVSSSKLQHFKQIGADDGSSASVTMHAAASANRREGQRAAAAPGARRRAGQ